VKRVLFIHAGGLLVSVPRDALHRQPAHIYVFACHMQWVYSVEAGRGGVGGTVLNETRGGRIVGLLRAVS
jgi:3-methyladenine DNA glycosylase Mpg